MKSACFLFLLLMVYVSCADKAVRLENEPNRFYELAIHYRDTGKTDSAFMYFNQAKDLFLQHHNQFNAGKCLINMALISTDHGDDFGGQELSLNAIPYLNADDPTHHIYIRSNLNNLGITSYKLRKFSQAIDFYKQSLKYTGDTTTMLAIMNNLALVYRSEKRYSAALEIYKDILAKEHDSIGLATAMASYAYTKWLQNPEYNAAAEFLAALNIRKRAGDKAGQNASYAYMADYYMKRNTDSALVYAIRMYEMASLLKSPDDRLTSLQKLIKVSSAKDVKVYFDQYQHLDDSLQAVRNAAKNQFALIRYETEKHKADNFKLQKEKTDRNIWIMSLVFLMIGGSTLGIIRYKKRKEQLRLENLNAIKDIKLKTSKKVHDVVANGLYRLMSEIENGYSFNLNKILDNMESLYEQSRDISYEDGNNDFINEQDFEIEIKELLDSFRTSENKIIVLGNTTSFWKNVKIQARFEIKHILQELMVNMNKHSGANHVAIRFEQSKEILKIHYTDNGVGIREGKTFGNGLRNTENRINSINGHFTFGRSAEGGLKIQIQFPSV